MSRLITLIFIACVTTTIVMGAGARQATDAPNTTIEPAGARVESLKRYFDKSSRWSVYETSADVPKDLMPDLFAAAESGDVHAQFLAGSHLTLSGEDPQLGRKYLELAAKANYCPGILHLAIHLLNNGEIPKAIAVMRRGAETGHVYIQGFLATLLDGRVYRFDHVRGELEEVLKWEQAAARGGDISSIYSMGMRFLHGRGVPQNYFEAYVLLAIASATDPYAQKWRDNAAQHLDGSELVRAQDKALERWKAMSTMGAAPAATVLQ